MKKLTVVITSGGTKEKIDDVRTLSNISTGKLGAKIADKFILAGHKVIYIAAQGIEEPSESGYDRIHVSSVDTVMETMRMVVPSAHVVLHPMAVSDFTFDYKGAVKCSSGSTDDFVQHIKNSIKMTPKVISNFRSWNPNAVLVGFKFTSGLSNGELLTIARRLKADNCLDMVFANDKMIIQKKGEHVGTLVMNDWDEECHGKDDISNKIFANVIRMAEPRFK